MLSFHLVAEAIFDVRISGEKRLEGRLRNHHELAVLHRRGGRRSRSAPQQGAFTEVLAGPGLGRGAAILEAYAAPEDDVDRVRRVALPVDDAARRPQEVRGRPDGREQVVVAQRPEVLDLPEGADEAVRDRFSDFTASFGYT